MTVSSTHIEILIALARYKYLCTTQIHNLFFQDKTLRNTQMHLKQIADKGLIKSDFLPLTLKTRNLGKVCYLTSQGGKAVEQELQVRNQEMSFSVVSKPIQSGNHYYHRKRLIDFLIQLDDELFSFSGLSIKILKTEARQAEVYGKRTFETLIQHDGFSIIPDITVVLQSQKTGNEAVYFVEIDCGTETIGGQNAFIPDGSLVAKFLKYEKLMNSECWKKYLDTSAMAFQVLTITEKETSVTTMSQNLESHLDERLGLFLFTTYERVEAGQLLRSPLWWNQDEKEYKPLL